MRCRITPRLTFKAVVIQKEAFEAAQGSVCRWKCACITQWPRSVTNALASVAERCTTRSQHVGRWCKHRSAYSQTAKGAEASAIGTTQAAATLRDNKLDAAQNHGKL